MSSTIRLLPYSRPLKVQVQFLYATYKESVSKHCTEIHDTDDGIKKIRLWRIFALEKTTGQETNKSAATWDHGSRRRTSCEMHRS